MLYASIIARTGAPVICSRSKSKADELPLKKQPGFSAGWSTVQQIFQNRAINENTCNTNVRSSQLHRL
ncbi:hypothetical protein DPMN_149411 [Dreissena polymorpha]|uniref:Uncharacterized protein n=1 Tax=Dreissena polymorpha TaxID=45954 RepID=A0A9D4J131_DREPO|nr:hypothetical protein DPMN_149392 [Dreissena polymorpha]KAH3795849.1 hypothetical protein DPMN_149411 [Dreissena polymorpha]